MWDIKTHKPRWPALVATAILALFLVGLYPVLAAPPSNDEITSATIVPGLPYSDYILDTTEATVAAGDPFPSCNDSGIREATVWYAFTPDATMSVVASTAYYSSYATTMGVYMDDQGMLSETHCATGRGSTVFQVNAGQTYYIMIAAAGGGPYPYPPGGYGGSLYFSLDVAPLPFAGFSVSTYSPSTFDEVWFYNSSSDPACPGCGLFAAWDFGDGTTSEEWSPIHRYAADGDYTVSLTITTQDGRTATTSGNLYVQTNDVAITGFSVPNSAKAGQTRTVTVEVKNTQYPVAVEVTLYKSGVWNWEWVDTAYQELPGSSKKSTKFEFNYTFTAQDAVLGRVNFRAVATIASYYQDALPLNNEVIWLPTEVKP